MVHHGQREPSSGEERGARMSSDKVAGKRPRRITFVAASIAALVVLAAAGVIYALVAGLGPIVLALHVSIAGFLVFLLVANAWLIPLSALTESARRVAGGDFDVHVEARNGGAVGQFAEAFNTMTDSLRERTESLTNRVAELSALYDMSYALSSTLDLDALLDSVLDAVLRIFRVDTGYIMLRERTTGAYALRAWRGAGEVPDERALRSSMSEWVIHQGRPLVYNPPQNGGGASETVDGVTGSSAAVCVPLITADGTVGALAIGGRSDEMRFSSQDVRLLTTIANHLTIAIGNADLFSSLQDAYLATVRSLAAAVDAKDPYTRGHSDSVALFARAAAERLGLSHEQCTALEMAAYLHDIGKIGISEEILRKPGRLDAEETGTMRHHPLIGANILRPVAFPWPIAPVVRHHHEHFDGSGYPSGLKGEEIPLLARILAVADAYEAMTADRPYRLSRTSEAAIAELDGARAPTSTHASSRRWSTPSRTSTATPGARPRCRRSSSRRRRTPSSSPWSTACSPRSGGSAARGSRAIWRRRSPSGSNGRCPRSACTPATWPRRGTRSGTPTRRPPPCAPS